MPHSPLMNSGFGSPRRPPYLKVLSFDHSAMFWMCFSAGPLLKASSASRPPKPFSFVANGTLCQAEKVSSCTQDCQPVVKPHWVAPDDIIFFDISTSSGQVFGGFSGSRPAFLKASLL